METANIVISRAQQTVTYPASFLLVAACNPCPCGYRGDSVKCCVCTPSQADRYWNKISGPLMDRIDLHVEVSRLKESELSNGFDGATSEDIRKRVLRAVALQRERLVHEPFAFNGQLTQMQLTRHCKIDEQSRRTLAKAVTQMGLSARAHDRILRIARTIADLAGEKKISSDHVLEAVRYRCLTHTR